MTMPAACHVDTSLDLGAGAFPSIYIVPPPPSPLLVAEDFLRHGKEGGLGIEF